MKQFSPFVFHRLPFFFSVSIFVYFQHFIDCQVYHYFLVFRNEDVNFIFLKTTSCECWVPTNSVNAIFIAIHANFFISMCDRNLTMIDNLNNHE